MTDEEFRTHKSGYDKLLDLLSNTSKLVTGVGIVVLTVIFGWLVFGRYVLNSTPTWVEQASLLLVMLIGFVGASVGIHENTHLSVSYFRDLGSPLVRRIFDFAVQVILLVFGAVMMVKSYELAVFKWSTNIPLIDLPEGLRTVPIVVCGALTCLYSIGHLVHLMKGEAMPENTSVE